MVARVRGEGSESSRNVSIRWTIFLIVGSFSVGMLFTNRMWSIQESKDVDRLNEEQTDQFNLVSEGCNPKSKQVERGSKDILGEVSKTNDAIQTLDKTISNLEMELAAARAAHDSLLSGSPIQGNPVAVKSTARPKVFLVIGINTAFSSRKRRDSVRETWMPRGILKFCPAEVTKGLFVLWKWMPTISDFECFAISKQEQVKGERRWRKRRALLFDL